MGGRISPPDKGGNPRALAEGAPQSLSLGGHPPRAGKEAQKILRPMGNAKNELRSSGRELPPLLNKREREVFFMAMSIAENIAAVRDRMAEAAAKAGRDPAEILLCGASKMNDAAACRAAIAAGIDCLGENRVQEMTQKLSEHAYDGAPLHFIGVLQKNKVRQVVGKVDLIHSVGLPFPFG